jgi:hypothetical protein
MNSRKVFLILSAILMASCTSRSNLPKNLNYKPRNSLDSSLNDIHDTMSYNEANTFKWVLNIPFYNELKSKLININDTNYIYPRFLLKKFSLKIQIDSVAKYELNQYKIIVKKRNFDPQNHSLDLVDSVFRSTGGIDYLEMKNLIDGVKAYGINGDIPKTELYYIELIINNDIFKIPNRFFSDLFNPNLGLSEVYLEPSKQLIYLYLSGSDGAGSYSIKYVFNFNGYLTRIVTELCGFDFIDGIRYDCI